jgi:hypothetical protein
MDNTQHPDPTTEAGARVVEAVAVFASLAEALARARAEQLRRRAVEDENEARRTVAEQRRKHEEARKAYRADEAVFRRANDPGWLQRADLLDLARAWRAAGTHAEHDPAAQFAMNKVEDRLRVLYPAPMKLYDQQRANGKPPEEAMRPAAAMMANLPPFTQGRPHGDGRTPTAKHLENFGPKSAASLAQEAFPVPLKEAFATIDLNPESTVEGPRRKHAQTAAPVRSH